MSNAVSPLDGASFDGFVSVREAGLRGMITVRGDLSAAKVKTAVKKVAGVAMPEQGGVAFSGDTGCAWMSPDELMIFVPYGDAEAAVEVLRKGLNGTHHLVANVSDARVTFTLEGEAVRDVLAKLSPADLIDLSTGQMRRSRLAQVPGAFWLVSDTVAEVVTFRSMATYAFGVLSVSAKSGGEVGFY